jgi:hypothetical protein
MIVEDIHVARVHETWAQLDLGRINHFLSTLIDEIERARKAAERAER